MYLHLVGAISPAPCTLHSVGEVITFDHRSVNEKVRRGRTGALRCGERTKGLGQGGWALASGSCFAHTLGVP